MTWRPDPFAHPAPHRSGASHAPSYALLHGWGPIVAAANAENGFTDPARMPNGSHAPRRSVDPADSLNRSTFDAD